MFENLRITSGVSGDQPEINLQWRWKYNPGDTLPKCEVFCCTIPESQLLRNSIFTKTEIIEWIRANKGINIYSVDTRIDDLHAYYNNPTNKGSCWLNEYQLINGGNISSIQMMRFPATDLDKIFFVCVYGERTFEARVFGIDTQSGGVPYDLVKPGVLDKVRGKTNYSLRFNDSGKRRRVLVSRYNNDEVYSVLPSGTEYDLDKDIDPEDIEKVVYISSLIN